MIQKYEPKITVVCQHCGIRSDEDDVKFLNIEEDFQGRDVLSFQCPHCGKDSESLRYG